MNPRQALSEIKKQAIRRQVTHTQRAIARFDVAPPDARAYELATVAACLRVLADILEQSDVA